MKSLSNIDVNGNKVVTLGTPTSSGDAATKGYVDSNAGAPSYVKIQARVTLR